MNSAFQDLANGDFEGGFAKLDEHPWWHDDRTDLEGPFRLGFPGAQGWGEDLLVASLLKRDAINSEIPVKVFADWQVCSILKHDPVFHAQAAGNNTDSRPSLAILRHALMGDLLAKPFLPLRTAEDLAPSPPNRRLRVGIAWASVSNDRPIREKCVPLKQLLRPLAGIDADFVSFQRNLRIADPQDLLLGFGARILSDQILDTKTENSMDELVQEIRSLDCMITISTTTAHIAASMGVRVELMAAERGGHQWFWQAQARHEKCLYPTVRVHLGDGRKDNWWKSSLASLEASLSNQVG